jgi:hypothetical protein
LIINFDKKKQSQLFNELIIENKKDISINSIHLLKELTIHDEDEYITSVKIEHLEGLLKSNNITF